MILTHISNVHEAGSKRDNEICIGIVGPRERERVEMRTDRVDPLDS
jgi:hypothetical protein